MKRTVQKQFVYSQSQSRDQEMQIEFISSKSEHTRQDIWTEERVATLGQLKERRPPPSLLSTVTFRSGSFTWIFPGWVSHLNIHKKTFHQDQQIVVIVSVRKMDHIYFDKIWLQFQLTKDWMSGQTILRQSGTTPSHAPEGKQVSLQAPSPTHYHHYHRGHHRITLNLTMITKILLVVIQTLQGRPSYFLLRKKTPPQVLIDINLW